MLLSLAFLGQFISFTCLVRHHQIRSSSTTNLPLLLLQHHPDNDSDRNDETTPAHHHRPGITIAAGVSSMIHAVIASVDDDEKTQQHHHHDVVITGGKSGELDIFWISNGTQAAGADVKVTLERFGYFVSGVNGQATLPAVRPTPIYSLAHGGSSDLVVSGAGDRYVSIWERQGSNWYLQQRLGSHTGWVKGVLLDETNQIIHSIGCNCIETWRRKKSIHSSSVGGERWYHESKTWIESCPTEGATLSSDLLCLAWLNHDFGMAPGRRRFFGAGGVDGRLHVWESNALTTTMMGSSNNKNNNCSPPKLSVAAHAGRLNAMAHLKQSDYLYTAGHDGHVRAWSLRTLWNDDDDLGSFRAVYSFGHGIHHHNVNNKADEDALPQRVTALCALKMDGMDHVLAGTNTGEVTLLVLTTNDETLQSVSSFQLVGRPIVNAICLTGHETDPTICIGHSTGLWSYPFRLASSIRQGRVSF